jgi:hypothetical protein
MALLPELSGSLIALCSMPALEHHSENSRCKVLFDM